MGVNLLPSQTAQKMTNKGKTKMATAMKINKAKYLEACKQVLAKAEENQKAYTEAQTKYENELRAWADMVVSKRMIKAIVESNSSWRPLTLFPNAEAEALKPEAPQSLPLNESQKIADLKEVIQLIEMTDGETIGISVANKVSHYVRGN